MKYKVGDEFKVTKNNNCGFQIRDVIRIERIEGDDEEELPYYIDSWYLGDNTTITNGDNSWNIDEFAELIIDKKIINDCDDCDSAWNIDKFAELIIDEKTTKKVGGDCGHMVVKGRAYEDIVSILLSNGYTVQVSKNEQDDFYFAEFEISYEKR